MNSLKKLMLLLGCVYLTACASLIASQTSQLADDIAGAIYNNNDVESVRQAIPTFLILIDGMIESSPDNVGLLMAGAQLNDAYSSNFVTDKGRQKRLSGKAMRYAGHGACSYKASLCSLRELPYDQFAAKIDEAGADDIDVLYTYGVTWLGWVQINSDDWEEVANLARVEYMLKRVVSLDGNYDQGMAYLYLGGIASLLPPALGGKPELAKEYFEQAISRSGERNLMAKVVYAERYARMMFEQELHDRLLQEVLAADPDVPGLVLINHIAQQQAKQLLASGAEYF